MAAETTVISTPRSKSKFENLAVQSRTLVLKNNKLLAFVCNERVPRSRFIASLAEHIIKTESNKRVVIVVDKMRQKELFINLLKNNLMHEHPDNSISSISIEIANPDNFRGRDPTHVFVFEAFSMSLTSDFYNLVILPLMKSSSIENILLCYGGPCDEDEQHQLETMFFRFWWLGRDFLVIQKEYGQSEAIKK